jgi:hypothetical protein
MILDSRSNAGHRDQERTRKGNEALEKMIQALQEFAD